MCLKHTLSLLIILSPLAFVLNCSRGTEKAQHNLNAASELPANRPDYPLELQAWNWEKHAGVSVRVNGIVKSVWDEPIEGVKVTAEFRDQNGEFVAVESGYVGTLYPHQPTPFEFVGRYRPNVAAAALTFTDGGGLEFPYLDKTKEKTR